MIFTDLCPHCNQKLKYYCANNRFYDQFYCTKDNNINSSVNFMIMFGTNEYMIGYPLDDNYEYFIQFIFQKNNITTDIFKYRDGAYDNFLKFDYALDTSHQDRFNLLHRIQNNLTLI